MPASAIPKFFDKHMKTRLVLQLLLDAMPIILMACAICALGASANGEPQWKTNLIGCALTAFLILTVPLFVMSVRLGKDLVEYELYPVLGKVSKVLRAISILPMLVAVFLDVLIIAVLLDIAYFTGFLNDIIYAFIRFGLRV